MDRKLAVGLMLAVLGTVTVAAELGRQTVDPSMVKHDYTVKETDWLESNVGGELSLEFLMMNWKIGSISADDRTIVPQVAAFYGVSDKTDIRASFGWYSVEDKSDDASAGFSDAGLDVARFGFGTRRYLRREDGMCPYAGAMMNFYIMEGDELGSIDSAVGLAGEAGLAYQIDDFVLLRAGIQLETSVVDGQTTVAGAERDVSLRCVNLGVGLIATM